MSRAPAEPQNVRLGGRPRRDDITPELALALRARGLSVRRIAYQLRAGYGTVRTALRGADGALEASENPNTEAL